MLNVKSWEEFMVISVTVACEQAFIFSMQYPFNIYLSFPNRYGSQEVKMLNVKS